MKNINPRVGETHKKTITLTDAGREQIQTYADSHNMSFSAAIETLALLGMEADLTVLLVPLLQETVDKALQRNFNRLAKLSLLGAAEAAMAHDLVTIMTLQMVRQEAMTHSESFEQRMLVSYDPTHSLDARIRAVYDDMRRVARERQQRILKRPLRDLVLQFVEHPQPENAGEDKRGES